jgi:hypothetical protein
MCIQCILYHNQETDKKSTAACRKELAKLADEDLHFPMKLVCDF